MRGLADVVERMGVPIYEGSPASSIEHGVVVTNGGRLRADMIVRATEGYSGTLQGCERLLLPLHSMMIATEPLPEHVFKEIGLENRETFADPRRMVIYGQRTADDRIAFGARGRYYFGSGVRNLFSADDPVFDEVKRTLDSLFPVLREHRVTHRWGGALGVPRDWRPSVGIDRAQGLGWAGGYVGEGVAASNLAARTLAELILGLDTERTDLPRPVHRATGAAAAGRVAGRRPAQRRPGHASPHLDGLQRLGELTAPGNRAAGRHGHRSQD